MCIRSEKSSNTQGHTMRMTPWRHRGEVTQCRRCSVVYTRQYIKNQWFYPYFFVLPVPGIVCVISDSDMPLSFYKWYVRCSDTCCRLLAKPHHQSPNTKLVDLSANSFRNRNCFLHLTVYVHTHLSLIIAEMLTFSFGNTYTYSFAITYRIYIVYINILRGDYSKRHSMTIIVPNELLLTYSYSIAHESSNRVIFKNIPNKLFI